MKRDHLPNQWFTKQFTNAPVYSNPKEKAFRNSLLRKALSKWAILGSNQ